MTTTVRRQAPPHSSASRAGRREQAWLADVLGRIADLPQQRLAELLRWNWRPDTSDVPLAQAA
ncbi:hypothetical protein [Polymorphobacter sp. PAMC 29334]|uniref:hypothetical protein n=1 Tax=Polymorphobacter sp. PAMC 29334 TaxID=2862331 RepID=UPI00272D667D|nr:hypothetical protein [Polymorphobacter sp. PAMC 29334]